ncbi:hypothetical protein G6L37_33055 [Agrobacterium rubi]|uniref:Nitrate reductase n=1 Tax=Agrobacterium rubi TaxID=28099 RepID=A0AAE7R8B5_9HYPH|nr:hypothetical protein [Agrobacterium rubi]NTF05667.1 hypothetical protein [Agrobacterium rubi]NTF10804.1 hypothetical protein [Agrobacterium rubi]NTF23220.1 hypothetical protein [Agrobacterium rubi]NTF30140.1 hypothetical protein [Agrobacterium rubi]
MNPLSRGSGGLLGRTREIKAWTRDIFNLPEDALVSVNELACHLPGCPPKETVVLMMFSDQTVQVSIHKAILEVTKEDISRTFSAAAANSN